MSNGRRGGARQMKHWHGSTDTGTGFTGTATAILSTFDIGDSPGTVLRTLGNVLVAPTGGVTFGADDQAAITLGIGIVSSDALAVGATAMPDPGGEPEFDWLWWYKVLVSIEDAALPGQEIGGAERIHFDSRAMRKMKPRSALVLVAQYVDIFGTPAMNALSSFRVLFGT